MSKADIERAAKDINAQIAIQATGRFKYVHSVKPESANIAVAVLENELKRMEGCKHCTNMGTYYDDDTLFCFHCGKRIAYLKETASNGQVKSVDDINGNVNKINENVEKDELPANDGQVNENEVKP